MHARGGASNCRRTLRVMKLMTGLMATLAVVLGSLGAAVAYRSASVTPATSAPPRTSTTAPVQDTKGTPPATRRPVRLRWKPCPQGTERRGKRCVRHVVRTVVVADSGGSGSVPAAGAAPQAPAPPAPVSAGRERGDAGGGRAAHAGDDRGEDRGGEAQHEHEEEPEHHEQEREDD